MITKVSFVVFQSALRQRGELVRTIAGDIPVYLIPSTGALVIAPCDLQITECMAGRYLIEFTNITPNGCAFHKVIFDREDQAVAMLALLNLKSVGVALALKAMMSYKGIAVPTVAEAIEKGILFPEGTKLPKYIRDGLDELATKKGVTAPAAPTKKAPPPPDSPEVVDAIKAMRTLGLKDLAEPRVREAFRVLQDSGVPITTDQLVQLALKNGGKR